jgi:hypothetical protein
MTIPKRLIHHWPALLALILGLLIGYVDLHNDEVWAALILLLPVTFLFGWVWPQRAWLWALLLGAGIPVGYLLALLTGQTISCQPSPACSTLSFNAISQSVITLIPALIGVYAAIILRWVVADWQSQG